MTAPSLAPHPVDTPVVNTALRGFSVWFLRLTGWTIEGVLPPEGTRGKTRTWKTGFYYIATGAGVPIVMAYMDYANKRSGLGPVFVPSGDIARDMVAIKAFYAPFKGKNAAQFDSA